MIRSLTARIHARLGDFWWYSLMIFCAHRTADFLNVFVGLYLVPKYISVSELGAVLPLTTFATCLAMPIAVFATTFRNEIINLAVAKEYGKLKTLLRGTFIATGIFFVLACIVCHFVLPAYLERMRLAKGSLGVLIIILAFVASIQPIFNNALQALKKFKATSVIGIIGAPLRLVTMLVAMPFRPVSGYFVGQVSTPSIGILASIFALRKELSVKAEPYWSHEVIRRVARFAGFVTIGAVTSYFWTFVSTTIIRQRLPEIDSAAYYMVSRFSEMTGFLSMTLLFTMFPYTAELARGGKSTTPIVIKASAAMGVFCGLLALFFWLFGEPILAFLPNGSTYASYYWAIPWLIGIAFLNSSASIYTGAESSAERFGYLLWSAPLQLIFAVGLLLVTGHGYFTNYIPASWTEFLKVHNINSLSSYLMLMTVFEALRFAFSAFDLFRKR